MEWNVTGLYFIYLHSVFRVRTMHTNEISLFFIWFFTGGLLVLSCMRCLLDIHPSTLMNPCQPVGR